MMKKKTLCMKIEKKINQIEEIGEGINLLNIKNNILNIFVLKIVFFNYSLCNNNCKTNTIIIILNSADNKWLLFHSSPINLKVLYNNKIQNKIIILVLSFIIPDLNKFKILKLYYLKMPGKEIH